MGNRILLRKKSYMLVLLSWIHDLLLFEGIYVFASAVQNIRGVALKFFVLEGMILLVPVILSWMVMRRCRNLWLFLMFSVTMTWAVWAFSGNVLTGFLTAFVFLFRCYVRLKEGEIRRNMRDLPGEAGAREGKETWELPTFLDTPRIIHCLLFVLMYLGVICLHRHDLIKPVLGLTAAELLVCLAYDYLERLGEFIAENDHVANLPAATMKKTGAAILLIGTTGLALFMAPAAFCDKEPLADLRFQAGNMEDMDVAVYEEEPETDYMMEELDELKSQAKKTPEWLKKLSEILSSLVLCAIIYTALRLALRAIRNAMEAFSDNGDEIIFLGKEEECLEGVRLRRKRPEKDRILSPDRKIRRFYKKMIRHALNEPPRGHETPLELELRAGLYEKGDWETDKIHRIYEKARYGKEGCSKEEVQECTRKWIATR